MNFGRIQIFGQQQESTSFAYAGIYSGVYSYTGNMLTSIASTSTLLKTHAHTHTHAATYILRNINVKTTKNITETNKPWSVMVESEVNLTKKFFS